MFRNLMLPGVALLLIAWLVLGSWWYSRTYCNGGTTANIPGFSLIDGHYEIAGDEAFSFYKSSADPIIPAGAYDALEALASYLSKEPGKGLKLFGVYSEFESDKRSPYANLGLARAEAIKSELVALGVDSNKIQTSGIRFSDASFTDGMMHRGVHFRFVNINDAPVGPASRFDSRKKDADLFQPMNIYFDQNEFDIILTEKLEKYLKRVKAYLLKNRSASIAIIGHADGRGNARTNLNLSETRARNVKKFMIRSGFQPSRLLIEYKGENQPLQPNNGTNEDQEKNRRVELRLRLQ